MNLKHDTNPLFGAASAVMTLGAGRMFVIAVESGTTLLLMRSLGPEPFGLVAIAMSIVVTFAVFAEGGIGSSLVSDRNLDEHSVGAAFVIAAGLSSAMIILALILTPLLVAIYQNPQLATVWVVTSILIGLSTLSSIPRALAQRAERFTMLAWTPAAISVVACIAALLTAQVRHDFWPILVRYIMNMGGTLVALLCIVRPRILRPRPSDFADISRFAFGVVGFSLLNALNRNADKMIIGRVLGPHALGLYTFASTVLTSPLGQMADLLRTVAYPRFSRHAPNWAAVSASISNLMRDVAMFTTPVCLGAALAAPDMITVIFGPRWLDALFPFRVLALLAVYQAPFAFLGLAYTISRETGTMARWGLIATPAIVLSFFVGLPWGIGGVAIAYAMTSVLLSVPMVRLAASVLHVSPVDLARGPLVGMTVGVAATLPLLGCYLGARALDLAPSARLLTTIAGGLAGELIMLAALIRVRFALRFSLQDPCNLAALLAPLGRRVRNDT